MHEYMWISDVSVRADQFHGRIDNDPMWLTNVKADQEVTVPAGEIADWMYVESGVLHGGYTLRVLAYRESDETRKEIERNMGAKIDPFE